MFTFGSLFAGIGGFDLGLERAGMTCRWQVEIDPFCQRVLAKHWPEVRRYGDVRKCGKHNLESADLIVGGFPCQPYSVAGRRRGAEDDRNLWPEFLRIVKGLRPTWILAENVPGIVSLYLDTVLSDLESENYACWTFNIPACAFGAPHRRYRIFIVAHANQQRLAQRQGQRSNAQAQQPPSFGAGDKGRNVAHAPCQSRDGSDNNRGGQSRPLSEFGDCGEKTRSFGGWWSVEPAVGRVADGVPHRVDRLRALGNAVVPQVAEWIGRRILEVESRGE